MIKVKCTHIDWDISDEDLIENFGSIVDDNGLPYTAKCLGLPAYDSIVEIEIDDDDWNDAVAEMEESSIVSDKLSDEYGWLVNSFMILKDEENVPKKRKT